VGLCLWLLSFGSLTLTYAVTKWRQIKQIAALACRSIFAIAFLFHPYPKTFFACKKSIALLLMFFSVA